MQSIFVVDSNLFTRSDVAQGEEQDVAIDGLHVSIRLARMVDVMRAVAASAAIKTPTTVDVADAQFGSMCATLSFEIGNAFAGVLGDLTTAPKANSGETTFAVDW